MLKALATTIALFAAAASSAMAASETEVQIDGGFAPLKGSLLMPDGDGPVNAVVILPGSGPTDRNGNSRLGLTTDSYKLVAIAFAEQGIASLRFDKRGIGASAAAARREEDILFDANIEDATAWATFLRQQPRVAKVVILGHSEGALTGTVAAQRPGIAGFISLAGPGVRVSETLRRQLETKISGDLKARAFAAIAELEAGRLVPNPPPELNALFRPSVQPYLISMFKIDPAAEIAKVKAPVMIVQGTTDLQVTVEDAKLLAAAKPNAKLLIIDGMNHVLRAAPADPVANNATYHDPSLPLKPELMPALVDFIRHAR